MHASHPVATDASAGRGPDAEDLRCVCLTGPTACGKTDLALALAESFPLEIVSMDSAMVYRDMNIGTAKPAPDVLAAYPHHLIDILDPAEVYSAGRFRDDAAAAIRAIRARGKLPLLVGGTLLYLRALRDGLAELPTRDPGLRQRLDREAADIGWPALHARLAELDPEAARRIAPGDRQRIQRALEVCLLSGRPLSSLQRRDPAEPRADVLGIAVVPPDRERLGERIAGRFAAMVAGGFIEEVQRLRQRPELGAETPSMRSVGYRQIWAYLDGRYDWPEAERRAITATRQFAKRQMTWLRSDPQVEALAAFSPGLRDRVARRIERLMPQFC